MCTFLHHFLPGPDIEQGHAEAKLYLGHMYLHGNGVDKDESEALKWFGKAAEQGHAGAKENIRQLQQ